MAYKPLDLNFLKMQYAPQRTDIRDTAKAIIASAGWGNEPTFAEMKAAAKKSKSNSQHKISPISAFFDLLSTPLYGMANALDEAVAGHQSDPNDSVLEDIGKTVGGIFTGAPKGIGAGLRGGTGLLDILPGVDINDDWQADPTDKSTYRDVFTRLATGMSTKDATNPKNWDKALEKARAEKSEVPDFIGNVFYGDLNQGDQQKNMQTLMKHIGITGVVDDILADPFNLAFGLGAGKNIITAPKKIEEGLAAARATNEAAPILEGLKVKPEGGKNVTSALPDVTVKDGAFDLGWRGATGFKEGGQIPPRLLEEIIPATGTKIDIAPIGSGSKAAPKIAKKRGMKIPQNEQKFTAGRIARTVGDRNWQYTSADALRQLSEKYGGKVEFTSTERMLDTVASMTAAGKKHNPKALFAALKKRIADDVEAASKPVRAENLLNSKNAVLPPELMKFKLPGVRAKRDVSFSGGKVPLKAKETELRDGVIRKFAPQIFKGATPSGIRSPEAYARAISSTGGTVVYNEAKQANMWNHITSNLKYANPQKFDKAVKILRAAEDFFIARGAVPMNHTKKGTAISLRLSQVAEVIGPQILGKNRAFITGILRGDEKAVAQLSPEARQAIEELKANEALADAPATQRGIAAGENIVKEIVASPSSVARKKELLNSALKEAKLTTARFGGSEASVRTVSQYIGNIIGKSDPVNFALNANRFKTEAWLSKASSKIDKVNDADFMKSVTSAIAKAADLPAPAKATGPKGAALLVKDWLGARFNAAYGVQDMRQIFLREQASAMATSARRAKIINELGRQFDSKNANLWHEAMRAAQMNGIADGEIAALQKKLAEAMENLFGGTGLRSGALVDSTVVGRSRLYMDELNANLRRFGLGQYQFKNGKKVEDAAGNVRDFSQSADWMKSWEIWNIKDPYTFLHKIQSAVEHTVREKVMFDEILARFASSNKHGNVKYGVNHPRLKGFYFNEEGARQATQFVKMLNEIATPNSKAMQHFDHVLSKLKASLTIYIPGHHMTNLIGDIMYNWMAGVNKPVRYQQAAKVMTAQTGRYGEFTSLQLLAGPNAMQQAHFRGLIGTETLKAAGLKVSAAGNRTIIKMKYGRNLTADMIYTAAMKEGILPSAKVLEEVSSDVTTVLDKFRPLGGKGQRAAHQVSEIRDHIPRLAQFIDELAKAPRGESFTSAVVKAAEKVRKWHPDGLDLTKFERTVMKRIFPFYSWTRKAIPLAIESSLVAGPKVMAYPRLMEAIATANGVDGNSPSDQFPADQLFPDWIRARGIGPIAGESGSYMVVNPSTPVLDMITLMGDPGHSTLDMLNPMGKVPVELANGQTLGRNVPISDYPDYLAKQIPAVSHLGRASGQFAVSDSTKAEGFPNWANIQNMMLGTKRVDTGKYQKSGQFDLREYFRKKAEQQGR